MRDEDIWRHIDQQRADLADFLDTLTPQQWATPSLCEHWAVRDVAAHLTHGGAHWARMGWEALRSGFRFNAMMVRIAVEDTRPADEIVAALRAMVGQRRRPPGTVVADPLMDVLVHGQDIARPLGIVRPMPTEAAVVAAERLWSMTFPFHPRKRFAGIAFTATDAPFAVGQGRVVEGPLSDIMLVLAGRRAGAAGLSGDAAALAGIGR
ncbi:maleylpyruvate isomerase family mycothiol-dependent enzyme [Mycobacterium sp. NPDC003323]